MSRLTLGLAAFAVLAAAGCTGGGDAPASAGPTPSPTAAPAAEPTAEPAAGVEYIESGQSVGLGMLVAGDDDCLPLLDEAIPLLEAIVDAYADLGSEAFNDFERFQTHAMDLDALAAQGCDEDISDAAIVRLARTLGEQQARPGQLQDDISWDSYIGAVEFAVSDLCAEGMDCDAGLAPPPLPPQPVNVTVSPVECYQDGGQVFARVFAVTDTGAASASVSVAVNARYQRVGTVMLTVFATPSGQERSGTGITSASGVGPVTSCQVTIHNIF